MLIKKHFFGFTTVALAGTQQVIGPTTTVESKCINGDIQNCISLAYQGINICATDDITCKCNAVNVAAEKCYTSCPSSDNLVIARNFVAEECVSDISEEKIHPPHYLRTDKIFNTNSPGKLNYKRAVEGPDILDFGRDPSKYYDSPERYNNKAFPASGSQKSLLETETSLVSDKNSGKSIHQNELNDDLKDDTEEYDDAYSHILLAPRTDLVDNFVSENEISSWKDCKSQIQESANKDIHAYHSSSALFSEKKFGITLSPEIKVLETYSNTFDTFYLSKHFPTSIPEEENTERGSRTSFESDESEYSVDLSNDSINEYPVSVPENSEEVDDSEEKFQELLEEDKPNTGDDLPDKTVTYLTSVASFKSIIISNPSTYFLNAVPTYTLVSGENQEKSENEKDESEKDEEENNEEEKEEGGEDEEDEEEDEEDFEEEETSNTIPEPKLSWKDKLLKKLKSTFGGRQNEKRALLATDDPLYIAENEQIDDALFLPKLTSQDGRLQLFKREPLQNVEMTSGATTMAVFWIPLMLIFSLMSFIDVTPFVFFILAGVATTYVKVFLPELVGAA